MLFVALCVVVLYACAQFGGQQFAALPDGLDEQTSLCELYIDSCPAAQQLIVSKLTVLTVLAVRVVNMSSSACESLISPKTTDEWRLIHCYAAARV